MDSGAEAGPAEANQGAAAALRAKLKGGAAPSAPAGKTTFLLMDWSPCHSLSCTSCPVCWVRFTPFTQTALHDCTERASGLV